MSAVFTSVRQQKMMEGDGDDVDKRKRKKSTPQSSPDEQEDEEEQQQQQPLRIVGLMPEDLEAQRLERRRRMNMIHSRRKRQRRKIEVEVLKEQVDMLTTKNERLRTENQQMEAMVAQIQQVVSTQGKPAAPPALPPPLMTGLPPPQVSASRPPPPHPPSASINSNQVDLFQQQQQQQQQNQFALQQILQYQLMASMLAHTMFLQQQQQQLQSASSSSPSPVPGLLQLMGQVPGMLIPGGLSTPTSTTTMSSNMTANFLMQPDNSIAVANHLLPVLGHHTTTTIIPTPMTSLSSGRTHQQSHAWTPHQPSMLTCTDAMQEQEIDTVQYKDNERNEADTHSDRE